MNKELLTNQLTIALADHCAIPVSQLKEIIEHELSGYSVSKMETTLPSAGNGEATKFILQEFCKSKANQGMNEETMRQYVDCAMKLVSFCQKDLNMIDFRDVNDFFRMRRGVVCQNTIHNQYRKLSSVFRYAQDYGYISVNPMTKADKIPPKKVEKKPLDAREEEVIKTYIESIENDKLRKRDIAMFYFLLDSGCRVSEFCNIRLGDVDFNHRSVMIRHGKGDKPREVFYSERTAVRLGEYFNTRRDVALGHYSFDAPLFASARGPERPIQKKSVELRMKEIGEGAGVPRLHPHLLRATFATHLVEKGAPASVVADLLGHANLNTIHRYVLLSDKKKREYFEQYV